MTNHDSDPPADGKQSEETSPILCPEKGDPLLHFLMCRMHMGPAGIFLIFFILFSVVTILLNLMQGTLWRTSEMKSALFSLDWATHWTSVPFLAPLLFGIVVVIYRRIPALFEELISTGVVIPLEDHQSFFRDLQSRYESVFVNVLLLVALAAGLVITVMVKNRQDFSDWTHIETGKLTIAAWYFYIACCVGGYVLARLAYSLFVTVGAIRRMFQPHSPFRVELKLMHPDQCCGLRPLSRWVLWISLLICVLGIMLAVLLITSYYRLGSVQEVIAQVGQPLSLVLYVILAPMAFFLPLLPVHRFMHETKKKFLLNLSKAFDRHYRELAETLEDENMPDMSACGQLKDIEEMYRHAVSMPVWPFDLGTLSRFVLTVAVPLALPVVPALLQMLFQRLA